MKNLLDNLAKITLTEKETKLLTEIKRKQNEWGHSDFMDNNCRSKSRAGVVSSLLKKGLIYDSYDNFDSEGQMYCLTEIAVAFVGVPKGWARMGCWEHWVAQGEFDYEQVYIANKVAQNKLK